MASNIGITQTARDICTHVQMGKLRYALLAVYSEKIEGSSRKKKEFIYALKTYPVTLDKMVPDAKVGTEDGKCLSKSQLASLYKTNEIKELTVVKGDDGKVEVVEKVVNLKSKKLPPHADDAAFNIHYEEIVEDARETLATCCGWVVAGIRHQTKSGATDYQPVLMSYCSDESGAKKKMLVGSSHGGLSNELGGFKFYQANGLDELSDLKAVRAIC
jgi:hypothetical protein